MAVDHEFIERSLLRIVEDEERKILRELSQVDSMFIKAGHGGGSSRWTMERHRIAEAGVDRAAMRMIDEVRQLAGQEAPNRAEDAGISVGHLTHRLLSQYRPGLGPTKEQHTMALLKIREKAIDDLRNRPVPVAAAPASLAGRDINITAGGHVAVAGRDAAQHVEGLDIAGLLAILSQVRQGVETSQLAAEDREALTDQVAAIEAVALQPKPDESRVTRLTKRLWPAVKALGQPVVADLLESYIKQHMGLS
jgi:hypothetical protein